METFVSYVRKENTCFYLRQFIGDLIDYSTTRPNGHIRLVKSCNAQLDKLSVTEPLHPEVWWQTPEKILHTYVTNIHGLLTIPWAYKPSLSTMPSEPIKRDLEKAIQSLFPMFGPHIPPTTKIAHISTPSNLSQKHTLHVTLDTHQCPFRQKMHKRSRLRLTIDVWAVILQCWSSACTTKQWWIPLKCSLFNQLFDLRDDLHVDTYMGKWGSSNPTWRIERYSSEIVHPYFVPLSLLSTSPRRDVSSELKGLTKKPRALEMASRAKCNVHTKDHSVDTDDSSVAKTESKTSLLCDWTPHQFLPTCICTSRSRITRFLLSLHLGRIP